jgi:porin
MFGLSATAMAAEPYEWGAALTLEAVHNLEGGIARGSAELLNADLTLAVDTEAAQWWRDGEWFVYALGSAGDNPSDWIGDIQGISNIAAPQAAKIYEFWYRHSFAGEQVQLLCGLHDFNSSFYTLDSASAFTHPSFGIGPDTAQVAPSIFPTAALALLLSVRRETRYWLASIYDGVPGDPLNPRGTHIHLSGEDGVFAALEGGWHDPGAYKLGLGYWYHTAAFEDPVYHRTLDNNFGFYALGEKFLGTRWAVFMQLGHARPQVNAVGSYLGLGVRFIGLWRADDSVGLAMAQARNSREYLQQNPDLTQAETAWELTYLLPLGEYVSLQTSFYYVDDPAMDRVLEDALALGLRLNLAI